MKPKKIVALKFDDGTEVKILDFDTLKRYVASLSLQKSLRELAASTPPTGDWATWGKLMEQMKVRRLKVRETKRANASKPRKKHVTKNKLIAFRDKFYRDEGKLHGWPAAACRRFKITRKTLDERMRK